MRRDISHEYIIHIQPDQINMAELLFWKKKRRRQSQVLQGTRLTRQCIPGHPVCFELLEERQILYFSFVYNFFTNIMFTDALKLSVSVGGGYLKIYIHNVLYKVYYGSFHTKCTLKKLKM